MTLKLIEDGGTEPLTLEQARRHLKIDDGVTVEDEDIEDWIVTARKRAEHETGRSLLLLTWERVVDAFPAVELELGNPTVASIVSVKYIDTAGVEQTMDPADYSLDADTPPGWVLPAYGTTWPATLDTANAVRVRFTAGYFPDGDKDRSMLRSWMKMQIGGLYKIREPVIVGKTMTEVPGRFVDGLLDPYRNWSA